MPKTVFTDVYNNKKMLEGVHRWCEAVGSTLGPRGLNVAINKGWECLVIHDGLNIGRSIAFSDPQKDLGVRIVREASQKQVQLVGDGSTAVAVLVDSILTQAERMISTGINAMSLRNEIESGLSILQRELTTKGKSISSVKDLTTVATISSADPVLGKLVAEVVHKMGDSGVISIEESKSKDTWVDYQEGMQFETGYLSPYFITDIETMTAAIENPYIWITDETITNINQCLPFINKITKVTKNLVVIAPDITLDPLAAFIETKVKGGMNILCIKAPLFNQHQRNFLQDIATLTGGRVISPNAGISYEDCDVDVLGTAELVTSMSAATTIIGGGGDKKTVSSHIKGLKTLLSTQSIPYEAEKTKERIAKLTNGVAVIRTGGETEIEMKERRERVDDAVGATKAALRSGIVPGGEVIYLHIRDVLDQTIPGHRILYKALEQPFRRLVENAGMDSGKLLERLETVNGKVDNAGFDVTKDETPIDLISGNIVDPLEVSREALNNSVSVSIQLLTSGYVIAPEKYPDVVS